LNARRSSSGRLSALRTSQEILVNCRTISFWLNPGRGASTTSSDQSSLSSRPAVTTSAEPSRLAL
jgi:hypothetical protein